MAQSSLADPPTNTNPLYLIHYSLSSRAFFISFAGEIFNRVIASGQFPFCFAFILCGAARDVCFELIVCMGGIWYRIRWRARRFIFSFWAGGKSASRSNRCACQPAFEFANGIKGLFDVIFTAGWNLIAPRHHHCCLKSWRASVNTTQMSSRVRGCQIRADRMQIPPPAALAAERASRFCYCAPGTCVIDRRRAKTCRWISHTAQPPPRISREEGRGCARISVSAHFD